MRFIIKHTKALLIVSCILILGLVISSPCLAINNSNLSSFGLVAGSLEEPYSSLFPPNDITGWNPNEYNCVTRAGGNCGETITGGTWQERLREVVEKYGIFLMNMQIEYGVPWELPIIHSHMESHFGLASPSVASDTEACGYYNWAGYTYGSSSLYGITEAEMGGCKVYHAEGMLGSMYKNIADMYASYYTDYLRNGVYDAAYDYASPGNFNPRSFLYAETEGKYCAPGCGAGYVSIYDMDIGTIHDIAREKGWPTSEELMREYSIPKGGNWSDTWGDIKNHINIEPHTASVDCSSMTSLGDVSGVSLRSGSSSGSSDSSSSSTSSSGSNVDTTAWEDGWIIGGFEGYTMEPAEGSSYGLPEEAVGGGHTQSYATDGKPNKILLHSTEGGPGNGTSGLALYGNVSKGGVTGITPAHFTIDLQNKRVFQHFSINKPSDAIIEDLDAGIQIEIIGYMNEGNEPSLKNFSDSDWEYLAKLLVAISNQTGIKLESSADWTHTNRYSAADFRNYKGVLGHMHAPSDQNHDDPGDIWSKIEEAINRNQIIDPCSGGTRNTGDFAGYVLDYAWTMDELGSMGVDQWTGTLTPKPGYKEAYDRRVSEGKYVGSRVTYGDCGGFVTTLMNESGYEPGYDYDGRGGNTIYQEQWLRENWELVGVSGGGFDTSGLQQGDVYIHDTHTFVFVGDIGGFGSDIASASWDTRVPQAGGNSASESGYRVYRKRG